MVFSVEVNWKEFLIGLAILIFGIPLLAFGGMAGAEQYNIWSICSQLKEVAADGVKQQYLRSLVYQWSSNEELFQQVKSEGDFLWLPYGHEKYGLSVDWKKLGLDLFGTGVKFVGEDSLVAVRFEEAGRAFGRNHITVLPNQISAEANRSEIILPGSVKIAEDVYVFCERWH